jgi:S-adenosylmethionine-diacylglycerol 3-amino-3-carboxypropyl transferase
MMAPRRAPGGHAARVQADVAAETRLKPLDKAFFYSDFVVEVVK